MNKNKKSIFNKQWVLIIFSLLGGLLLNEVVNLIKLQIPRYLIILAIIFIILIVIFIFYEIDFRKDWKEMKDDIKYIKNKIDKRSK